jgi:hypothetical protein
MAYPRGEAIPYGGGFFFFELFFWEFEIDLPHKLGMPALHPSDWRKLLANAGPPK